MMIIHLTLTIFDYIIIPSTCFSRPVLPESEQRLCYNGKIDLIQKQGVDPVEI